MEPELNIKEALRKTLGKVDARLRKDDKNMGKLIKEIPATEEQKKGQELLRELEEEADKKFEASLDMLVDSISAKMKHKTHRDHFWGGVEIELGMYTNGLAYNEETGMIEVYESVPDIIKRDILHNNPNLSSGVLGSEESKDEQK